MSLGEKLSSAFIRFAVGIETSEQDMGWKEVLVDPLYALASVANGTYDFAEARVHYRLRKAWDENVRVQQRNIETAGFENQYLKDFSTDSSCTSLEQLLRQGVNPVEAEIIAADVDYEVYAGKAKIFLACKLDELVERGVERKKATKYLMTLDLRMVEERHFKMI